MHFQTNASLKWTESWILALCFILSGEQHWLTLLSSEDRALWKRWSGTGSWGKPPQQSPPPLHHLQSREHQHNSHPSAAQRTSASTKHSNEDERLTVLHRFESTLRAFDWACFCWRHDINHVIGFTGQIRQHVWMDVRSHRHSCQTHSTQISSRKQHTSHIQLVLNIRFLCFVLPMA